MHSSSIRSRSEGGWSGACDHPERFLYEDDVLLPGEFPPEPERDVWSSGEAHDQAASALERVTVRFRKLVAEQYAGIAEVLRDAAERPEPWVGPDPTHQPDWCDPRERSAAASTQRAARHRRARGRRRPCRTPAVVGVDGEDKGGVCRNTRDTVPAGMGRVHLRSGHRTERRHYRAARRDAPDRRSRILVGIRYRCREVRGIAAAGQVPDPRPSGAGARASGEHRRPPPPGDRRPRCVADPELDGMASVTWLAPAANAASAYARIDADARHLRDQEGEERTLAQLRADVLSDLLISGTERPLSAEQGRASVAITVPGAHSAWRRRHACHPRGLRADRHRDRETACRRSIELGADSHSPGHGHRARRRSQDVSGAEGTPPLAGRPRSGMRVPRMHPAREECQIDHRVDWQYGGTTDDTNLAPMCEPHHVIKTKSIWSSTGIRRPAPHGG